MKRVTGVLICIIMISLFIGCSQDRYAASLETGKYCATNLTKENMTPVLHLDTESNTFYLCRDVTISYAETGTYEVVGRKLIATSQSTTYQFRIANDESLTLIDSGNNEDYPIRMRFVFDNE